MNRFTLTSVLTLALATQILSAPPKLEFPNDNKIQAKGDWVNVSPTTDATTVTYVGLSGLDPFPQDALKDTKRFVLPVRGLPEGEYKFIAFATKGDEHTVVKLSVIVGKPKPVNPDIKPEPDTDPDADPDPDNLTNHDNSKAPTKGAYVLIIHETGPDKPISAEHFTLMYGQESREFLDKYTNFYRVYDKDATPSEQPWKEALERKRDSIPWIIVVYNQKYIHEGPLPTSIDGLKKIFAENNIRINPRRGVPNGVLDRQVKPLTNVTPGVVTQNPFPKTTPRDSIQHITVRPATPHNTRYPATGGTAPTYILAPGVVRHGSTSRQNCPT